MFGIPKVYLYIAAAIAAISYYSWFVYSIRQDAKNEVLQEIGKAENDARDKAIKGARSVDACYDAGGVWDRSAGTCGIPQGGR